MKHALYPFVGLAAVAIATLAAMAIMPGNAAAGIQSCGPPPATATPNDGVIAPFGITTDTPTSTATATATSTSTATSTTTPTVTATSTVFPTCTPVHRGNDDTATPTHTPTPAATAVPGSTNTPVPPPATVPTKPSGGAGAGVFLPDTGSGPGGSSFNWLALGAIMLALSGGGSLVLAARRRG